VRLGSVERDDRRNGRNPFDPANAPELGTLQVHPSPEQDSHTPLIATHPLLKFFYRGDGGLLVGVGGGLGAVADAEFGHDGADVGVGGFGASVFGTGVDATAGSTATAAGNFDLAEVLFGIGPAATATGGNFLFDIIP
jgi:hypothetical protein